MAVMRSRAKSYCALALATGLGAALFSSASGSDMSTVQFAQAGGGTQINENRAGFSETKVKEMIQSMKAFIAKSSAARANLEESIRSSAARPSQALLDQHRRFGEQQKEFVSQVKELCGLLASINTSENVDECIQAPSK